MYHIENYYRITEPDFRFAVETANRVNEDYPQCAIVKNNCCYITIRHKQRMEVYVLNKINSKGKALTQ